MLMDDGTPGVGDEREGLQSWKMGKTKWNERKSIINCDTIAEAERESKTSGITIT